MLSFWIVEKFYIIKYVLPSFFAVRVGFSPDPLPLKKLEKALSNSVDAPIFVNALFYLLY